MNDSKRDRIDIVELVKFLWEGRRGIILYAGVSLVIGLIYAFIAKVEYRTTCKLLPEASASFESNLGGLGNLAGLAGINLRGASKGSLTSELYPQVVESVPLLMTLVDAPLEMDGLDSLITSREFFEEIDNPDVFKLIAEYTVLLPYKIKNWIVSKEPTGSKDNAEAEVLRLTLDEMDLLETMRERISISSDRRTGVITISVEFPNAMGSAQLANEITKLLKTYVTDYTTGKARENLEFLKERYEEAKANFESKQLEIAKFTDSHKNVATALMNNEYQRLQSEFDLAFDLYKNLANQLEQAKIEVKHETPVFTVLEPVVVPVEKSKPRRTVILIVCVFLGGTIGSAVTLFKEKYL